MFMYFVSAIVFTAIAVALFKIGNMHDQDGRSAIVPYFFGVLFMLVALYSFAAAFGLVPTA